MAQRQFKSTDTNKWYEGWGTGVDGALTISANTTEAPIDSACTGTAADKSLTATNASFSTGQLLLIHQTQGTGAGNWELNKISSYVSGTITLTYPLMNTYGTGAQVRVMKQHTTVTVNTGVTYTAKAWNGTVGGILAFFSNGTFTISGTGLINIAGTNATAGVGAVGIGFRGNLQNTQGEGTAGAGSSSTAANGNGGGSGMSGANSATGGGGGNATAGTKTSAGFGGTASGSADLTSMTFGGGGGGGGAGGSSNAGTGAGGGILLAICKDISCAGTGVTTAKGGNGATSSGGSTGGVGGAGGSILLKGDTIAIGTNLFIATAGTGTTGSQSIGGTGSVGRIHIDYKTSLSGTTNPTLDSAQDSTLIKLGKPGGSFIYNLL